MEIKYPHLVERALRSYSAQMWEKVQKLPPNATDDYFCSLAYEAMDADALADEIRAECERR